MPPRIPTARPLVESDSPGDDRLFSRLVIGVDFTPASLAAARWATAFVARRAETLLAHVEAPREELAPPLPEPGAVAAGSSAISAGLDGFGSTLQTSSLTAVLRMGRPSYWLTIIAGWSEATLMVLGRRSDSPRRRVGEPNVRERVARRTSSSVLVVPEGTIHSPNYVLAAVDEGLLGRAVLATAAAVASLHRIPLVVLHVLAPVSGAYERVIDTLRRTRRDMPQPLASSAADGTSAVTAPRWLAEVSEPPVAVAVDRVQVAVGDPAREIVSAGMSLGAPLIVVGKRGADGAPIGSLGSVTRILLASCPFPVLAIE